MWLRCKLGLILVMWFGNLNLPGVQVVVDLKNQFGFKLPKGDKLPI